MQLSLHLLCKQMIAKVQRMNKLMVRVLARFAEQTSSTNLLANDPPLIVPVVRRDTSTQHEELQSASNGSTSSFFPFFFIFLWGETTSPARWEPPDMGGPRHCSPETSFLENDRKIKRKNPCLDGCSKLDGTNTICSKISL